MKKIYFTRPLYFTAGKLAKILKDFQKRQDNKREEKRKDAWTRRFNGQEYFEFSLKNNVKINLYKDSVLSEIIYDGFEEEEIYFITSTLKKGDIFIDIGSNIGLFSLLASKIVGNNGKVICFEPDPKTFKRLGENINLNDFKNIDSRNIGLSEKDGELIFYVSKNGYDAWNSFAPSQDNKLESQIQVRVSTLDFELRNIEKSKISLVKIDVEGWEKFVLRGGMTFFNDYSPIVMVEFTEQNTFNAGYPVHDIYDFMINLGYQWYRINNGELNLEKKKLYYPYDNLIAIKAC
jgi:FkbM family methyltransferase